MQGNQPYWTKNYLCGAHVLMSVGAKNGNTPLDTLKDAKGNYFFQVGANAQDMITLTLSEGFHMSGLATMAGIVLDKKSVALSKNNGDMRWLVHEASLAQATLGNIDKMIEIVDSKRAALGAIQKQNGKYHPQSELYC